MPPLYSTHHRQKVINRAAAEIAQKAATIHENLEYGLFKAGGGDPHVKLKELFTLVELLPDRVLAFDQEEADHQLKQLEVTREGPDLNPFDESREAKLLESVKGHLNGLINTIPSGTRKHAEWFKKSPGHFDALRRAIETDVEERIRWEYLKRRAAFGLDVIRIQQQAGVTLESEQRGNTLPTRIWTVDEYYRAKDFYEKRGLIFNPALDKDSPAAYHVIAQAQLKTFTGKTQGGDELAQTKENTKAENTDFHSLAFKLLDIDALPLPRSDGFDGDPYLTDQHYQTLCNIVCERVPGMTTKEWWDASTGQRIACMEAALRKGTKPAETGGEATRAVFALHGIRTHAAWQRAFFEVAQAAGWRCRLDRWNFGFFWAIRFLLLPSQREAKVLWFRKTYDEEKNDSELGLKEGEYPSIIAHSFGTYILGNALLKYDWLHFDRIVLCGSILPPDFPWDQLIERGQVQAVRNEFGTIDFWTRVVRWFVRGTGPSGRSGFTCKHERFEQEEFRYSHSEYFEKGHMKAKWLPFLKRDLFRLPTKKAKVPLQLVSRPWGLYAFYAILIGILCILVYLWFSARGPADHQDVEFAIKALPQHVNQPQPEYATFSVFVHNQRPKAIAITHAELSPVSVNFDRRETEFKMLISRIRHDGHHTVSLQNPQVGKRVRFDLPILIPARNNQEFFIWLRLADREEQAMGFLRMEVRLTLCSENGETFTSQPFNVSIYFTPDPAWLPEEP